MSKICDLQSYLRREEEERGWVKQALPKECGIGLIQFCCCTSCVFIIS